MDYPTRLGPESTPKGLKSLLAALFAGGLLTGFFHWKLFPLLALSLPDLLQGWLFQLFTYPFVLGSPLGWGSLLVLTFEMLILWTYGSLFIERKGVQNFLLLFFGAAFFSGLASLFALYQSNSYLFGPSPSLFALLLAWMSLNPDAEIWLFGTRCRLKSAILGLLAIDLLIHLSQQSWTPLFANASGALFGTLYYKISAFKFSRPEIYRRTKVYDIKSGKPVLDDEAFMDAMLARVSLLGEESLTQDEKKRMQNISSKRPTGR